MLLELQVGVVVLTDTLSPCVFFDRDGIVNLSPGNGYVLSPDQFIIHRAFIDALKIVKDKGCLAAIITNQRCVGKGMLSEAVLQKIHQKLINSLHSEGLALDGIFACTTADPDSPLRKPRPGLFFQAQKKLKVDLSRSWMIGDQQTDVLAGRSAGCKTVLVSPGENLIKADIHLLNVGELPGFLDSHLFDVDRPAETRMKYR